MNHSTHNWYFRTALILALFLFVIAGCTTAPSAPAAPSEPIQEDVMAEEEHADAHEHEDEDIVSETEVLRLPELQPVALDGRRLQVIATTSIIGDVVSRVGGEAIALTTLMGEGQDPHSYQPAARDMAAVSQADLIFVNGWDLEGTLARDLTQIGKDVPIAAISANIEPLAFGGEGEHKGEAADLEHEHSGADPHVWLSVHNVRQWVDNTAQVLSSLDPANAETYARNAAAYQTELAELEDYAESMLAQIPQEKRYLVTNHDAFGYFAHDYDFEVLGTVLPGASTLAEPSASAMSALIQTMQEHDVCALFAETTVNDTLAQTVASELKACDGVQVLKLYTGALGPAGSGADSYIGMYRANVDTIVEGLR